MEVPGFVTASPQDGISGISIVPFPELLSMFDAVEDGCDVLSFDSMFIGFSWFLINPERYQEHFTPQKHFDSAPSRLSLLLGFGISFARARRLRKIWGTHPFPCEFSFTETSDFGTHGNICVVQFEGSKLQTLYQVLLASRCVQYTVHGHVISFHPHRMK